MYKRPGTPFLAAACLLGLALTGPGCDDDVVTPGPGPPSITSAASLITALAQAVSDNDCDRVSTLLANEPSANAEFRFVTCTPTDLGETYWGYAEETLILCRLLEPMIPLPGVPPVPPDLCLEAITLTLTPQESFTESPDSLYSADGGADGKLDPLRWRATEARYSTYFFFDLVGTDYKVEGDANFVVIEDLTKHGSESGRFLLYLWEDLCVPMAATAAPWSDKSRIQDLGQIKAMYRARHRPETVLEALASAYSRRDLALLESVLAHEPSASASYVFVCDLPGDLAVPYGYELEMRIHGRMFRPDRLPPGAHEVPQELWPQAITVSMWTTQGFHEVPELYSTGGGQGGMLDPLRWRALGASYETYGFFDLAGTDYKIETGAQFVVIEDLTKQKGEEGKFLLYLWDDRPVPMPGLAPSPTPTIPVAGVVETTWTFLKGLYL